MITINATKQKQIAEQRLTNVIEKYCDEQVAAKGYDSVRNAMGYAGAPGPYQAEGQAAAKLLSDCWVAAYAIQADVEAGTRAIPTEAEMIAEMPSIVWPI